MTGLEQSIARLREALDSGPYPPMHPRFGTWVRDTLCDMEWDRRRHSGDP